MRSMNEDMNNEYIRDVYTDYEVRMCLGRSSSAQHGETSPDISITFPMFFPPLNNISVH